MTAPETDPIGTVRQEPGSISLWVKTGHNLWTSIGGPHSGARIVPNTKISVAHHLIIGAVPGSPAATASVLVSSAAATAADRFVNGGRPCPAS